MAFFFGMVLVFMFIFMRLFSPMNMDLTIKVLRFTPNQRRPDSRLNRKTALVAQAPLQDRSKQTVDGVVPWLALKIVFQTTVALNRENGRGFVFTRL